MTKPLNKTLLRTALLPLLLSFPLPVLGQASDPITTEATELLDETGLLARQSRLGEGILILDRQLRHAEAIEKLIQVLGPDALIEVAPGEFLRFSDTPAGMRARIEMVRLQRELDKASAPTAPAQTAQPSRSDGSELLDMIDRRLSELTRAGDEVAGDEGVAEISTDQDRPLSVREIFGTGADLSAILQYGPDRVRVRAGDSLIGGLRILSIGPDGVHASRRGQDIHLRLPN
jgi:hypothetical protein